MIKIFKVGLIAGLFFLFQSSSVSAQDVNRNRLKLGLENAFAVGDYSELYKWGIGFSFSLEKSLADKISLTARAGFLSFSKQTNLGNGKLKRIAEYVPVKGGVKYYFGPKIYGEAETGMSISSKNTNMGISFIYSPGVGVEFGLGGRMKLDLGFRYESWIKNTSSNFLGLRTAIILGK